MELREIIIFLAGAQTFHTISHIFLRYINALPLRFWGINFTQHCNTWAIIINALITIGLFWYLQQL